MKVTAVILWLGALGLLCLAGWALFEEEDMWGHRYYRVVAVITVTASVFSAAASYLFSRARQRQGADRSFQPPTVTGGSRREWATAGGVGVILATGFAALVNYDSLFAGGGTSTIALSLAVVVLAVGGAIAMSRFIASHGDEIGEARFDTRNKGDSEA